MGIVKAGVCLHLTSRDQTTHLYVVLNDPAPHGDVSATVAIVNLSSTLTADKTVVLKQGDHSFVRRETSVVYGLARVVDATKLEAALEADRSKKHQHDCSPELLKRIRDGVFKSSFANPAIQQYCKDKFGELAGEQLAQAPEVSGDS